MKIKGFNKREFISFWNKKVKDQYKLSRNYDCYSEKMDFLEGRNIEIPSRYTKTGNPIIYL